ncbi:MAG: DUF302 domain-containing protein [Desulfuromonadales bacterium]|nr:DUF302 domain-containing protein [Desulfuromonadales bacterium]
MQVYRSETKKPVEQFVSDLFHEAKGRGFMIHNEDKMEMAHTFGQHGVEVADDFDLHMIQICKPQKAAMSLGKNPERAILMPKFIMTFSRDKSTQIRFQHYSREAVASLVDDEEFPESLLKSFEEILAMIEAAK